jgi:hypothetical protein
MTMDRLTRAITDTLDDLALGKSTDYIDDVLARTARTRQRPAWTFPGRYLTMSAQLKFVTAAVLMAAIGVSTAVLLAQQPDVPAPATCPSPAAEPTPTAAASPETPVIGDCELWIAYEWGFGEPGIKAVRPDGTGAHVIASAGDDPVTHVDWSRDGSRIAFDRGQGELLDVWTANADGTDARLLVGCDRPCLQLSNPAWSPDDRSIVVQRWDRPDDDPLLESCHLEVIDVVSLERRVVLDGEPTADGAWQCAAHPRWSPDGSRIVVTLDDWQLQDAEWVSMGRAIAIIDATGPASQEPLVLTDPALQATHPDWHPSDELIVFGTNDLAEFQDQWPATNLYTIRTNGADLTQVTDYGAGDVRATFPTWTPDGERIIFSYVTPVTSDDFGGRGFAFIAPDGTGLRVVPGVNGVEGRLRPVP